MPVKTVTIRRCIIIISIIINAGNFMSMPETLHRRKLHVNAGNFTPQETSCQCRKLYTAGNFTPQETFRRKKSCVYTKLPCVKLSFPIKNARPCRASILSFCFTSQLRDFSQLCSFSQLCDNPEIFLWTQTKSAFESNSLSSHILEVWSR